ncbi:hypothetical protein ACPESV_22680 [Streptomyces umbrinus]|uniref:hypothetical protein n=1 Tax=Streptomyces umbrinus TaxID=67370 RepID=UPI003C2F6732
MVTLAPERARREAGEADAAHTVRIPAVSQHHGMKVKFDGITAGRISAESPRWH